MQYQVCSDWLTWCCYAVAIVLWMVAKALLCGLYRVLSMFLLSYQAF